MSRPVRGVVSRRVLLADGWDATSLQRELRSGRLVAVRRGAYAPAALLAAAAREPKLARAVDVAAVAATQGRRVVASHLTAAVLHGLDVLHAPSLIELTSPTGVEKLGRGYRIRVAALPASDVDTDRGVGVTTVARTVVDIARTATRQGGLGRCRLRAAPSPGRREAVARGCGWLPSLAG